MIRFATKTKTEANRITECVLRNLLANKKTNKKRNQHFLTANYSNSGSMFNNSNSLSDRGQQLREKSQREPEQIGGRKASNQNQLSLPTGLMKIYQHTT